MNLNRYLYFLIALVAITVSSCSKKSRSTMEGNKPRNAGDVEPEQVRPDVDTRFQEQFFKAQLEKAKGNMPKAYEIFEECLKIEPNNAAAHYELGKMDLQILNNAQAALDHAKKCVESDKTNAWYHLLLADSYSALAKYDLAIKSYNEVARLNPDDPNVLYSKANAQLYAGKYQDAINTYDELEKKSGPFEELTMQKHQLYLQINNQEKAGLELEKLADAYPEEPRYWGMAAQFYRDAGMEEKWKAALESMKKINPESGQIHFQLSEYYAAKGDSKKSYDELKLAFQTTDLGIDQKMMVLLKYLSLTDFKPEFSSQAYELLELTEQLHLSEAKIYSIYGDFLYRDGKKKEAVEKYSKARDLDPSIRLIWDQILIIQSELQAYDAMAVDSRKAVELFPTIPDFYYYNGVANERLKKYKEALDALLPGKEMVIDNDDMLIRFYSAIGECYHYTSQHAKSDEAYDEAIRLDSRNVFVLNNYAYYLSLRKEKLEKAADMSRQCNELSPGIASFEDTYAWILFQQGKYQDALTWIEKALSRGETNGELLEHLGDILFKLGRTQEALAKWKEAQSMGGASERISQKIDQQKFID